MPFLFFHRLILSTHHRQVLTRTQVLGSKQTGKTSFLRLLLETSDIAPSATLEQRAELEAFLSHSLKSSKRSRAYSHSAHSHLSHSHGPPSSYSHQGISSPSGGGNPSGTHSPSFNSVQIEIMDSPTDRLLLTVIDTPGLDFSPGRELVLEQQTNSLVYELESRFGETLVEESKVVRKGGADRHIHL